jgi:hypothetical protein
MKSIKLLLHIATFDARSEFIQETRHCAYHPLPSVRFGRLRDSPLLFRNGHNKLMVLRFGHSQLGHDWPRMTDSAMVIFPLISIAKSCLLGNRILTDHTCHAGSLAAAFGSLRSYLIKSSLRGWLSMGIRVKRNSDHDFARYRR